MLRAFLRARGLCLDSAAELGYLNLVTDSLKPRYERSDDGSKLAGLAAVSYGLEGSLRSVYIADAGHLRDDKLLKFAGETSGDMRARLGHMRLEELQEELRELFAGRQVVVTHSLHGYTLPWLRALLYGFDGCDSSQMLLDLPLICTGLERRLPMPPERTPSGCAKQLALDGCKASLDKVHGRHCPSRRPLPQTLLDKRLQQLQELASKTW